MQADSVLIQTLSCLPAHVLDTFDRQSCTSPSILLNLYWQLISTHWPVSEPLGAGHPD